MQIKDYVVINNFAAFVYRSLLLAKLRHLVILAGTCL